MITITYHIVAPPEDSILPEFLIMTPDKFKGQLQYLKKNHRILNPDELYYYIDKDALPTNSCILTFDDGHLGQFKYALPILEELDLTAFFFVPTCILYDKRLPVVEKQRILQYADDNYEKFYADFCAAVQEVCPGLPRHLYYPFESTVSQALSYYSEYKFYSPLERLFRKVRETLLTAEQFEEIINGIFGSRYSEQQILKDYFMEANLLKKMLDRGAEFGGHGHNHLIDTSTTAEIIRDDVRKAFLYMHDYLNKDIRSYAYPYGIYTETTIDAISSHKTVKAGFTCSPGIGMKESFLFLDRFDCKEFPTNGNEASSYWSKIERSNLNAI